MPELSVILPVFNAERYVRAAVQSILAQTYRDFTLILIDDGSTDGSAAVCRTIAAQDNRIQFNSRPNKGLTRTLNEALSMVNTPLIARMDSDDLSLPERFAKQIEYLNAHPECVCLGTRLTLIDPYDSPVSITDHKLTHDEIDADLLNGIGWAIVHPAAMMRTDAVRKVGGYREQYTTSQRLDLFLRLAEVGKLANLPEPLVQYRQHFDSVAFNKAEDQWNVKSTIVGDAYRRRGLPIPGEWNFNKRIPLTRIEQLKRWTWAALRAGNPGIARKHAVRVMGLQPFSLDSWRVMYCALRGR